MGLAAKVLLEIALAAVPVAARLLILGQGVLAMLEKCEDIEKIIPIKETLKRGKKIEKRNEDLLKVVNLN
jgi:hypothetical protein